MSKNQHFSVVFLSPHYWLRANYSHTRFGFHWKEYSWERRSDSDYTDENRPLNSPWTFRSRAIFHSIIPTGKDKHADATIKPNYLLTNTVSPRGHSKDNILSSYISPIETLPHWASVLSFSRALSALPSKQRRSRPSTRNRFEFVDPLCGWPPSDPISQYTHLSSYVSPVPILQHAYPSRRGGSQLPSSCLLRFDVIRLLKLQFHKFAPPPLLLYINDCITIDME